MYSWVDILFSLSFYRGCEGKGSSYQIERKDSWSHYVSDTNSITRSVACAPQHFLSFISAAALPPSTLLWKSTPQRTNSIATGHCSISTSWAKGASWAEKRAHRRLGGPVQPYPSLLPVTQSFKRSSKQPWCSQVSENIYMRGGWATPVPRGQKLLPLGPFQTAP